MFEVPVNANKNVLAMQTEKDLILTQNDDNQEREEPDSLNLVLKSDTETASLTNSICDFGRSLVFLFSAADESGAEKALSSVCLSGLSEVGSIHFSEVFHNFFSMILITNVYHKICLQLLFC